ncbi:hypothetical protein ACWCXC_15610 [Streptomyces sp. NPDC001515]
MIKVIQENGKFTGHVGDMYETPAYVTEEMAQADAKCWLAFNGEALDEYTRGYQLGLAARRVADRNNTITVSTGTFVIPSEIAFELRSSNPHPRSIVPGMYHKAMMKRQEAFQEVERLCGIDGAEARKVPALLRANSPHSY